MNEWNSFRRVNAVFNGEIPDKVPKFELSIEIKELNPTADGQKNVAAILFFSPQMLSFFHRHPSMVSIFQKILKHPSILQPIAKSAVTRATKIHREYNYDMFNGAGGVPMIFNDRIFRDFHTEDNNNIVRRANGKLVWKTSPEGAHTRYGFLETPGDWDKYIEFDSGHPGNYFLTKNTIKTCKKLDIVPSFFTLCSGFFEDLSMMFGFENLFKLLVKDKGFIRSAVKEMSDYSIAVAERLIELGATYLYMTNDLGYKERSIISPRMFQDLFKPGIKKFCRRVHQLGGKVMMHSCGYVENLLPDIIEAGIDALHPIEKAAGNDIAEIKKKYGKDIILIGNVPIPLLSGGTPKENYDYVKDLLMNVSKDGGHIISSSHSVTQWCKVENYLAYHKAVEDFGIYPINIK